MKNSQKGFVVPLIIVIAVLVVGGGVYYYSKNPGTPQIPKNTVVDKTADNTQNTSTNQNCGTGVSEANLLCELEKAYAAGNSKTAVIRLQGSLDDYYRENKQEPNVLIEEINNTNKPIDYRVYLIKILSINKDNFSSVREKLIGVILNKKNGEQVRAQMIQSLPKMYYAVFHVTRINDNDDLFNAVTSVLKEQNDTLSSSVIAVLYGQMANLDMQRSIKIITGFSDNYAENYKKTPVSLINALTILKNTKTLTSLTTEGINYVCSKNDPRAAILCRK